MTAEKLLAKQLLEQFLAVIAGRLNARLLEFAPPHPQGADALLAIGSGEQERRVLVQVLRSAYPRDVRAAVWKMQGLAKATVGEEPALMVMADALSPGARRELEQRKIGYFDASGSLFLDIDGLEILVDRPHRKPQWKAATSIFTPERAKVLHALLLDWHAWRSGPELCEACGASPNTVSVLMRELEKREWVQTEGGARSMRRRLVQPEALLEAWANHWPQQQEKSHWFAFSQDPNALPAKLAEALDQRSMSEAWAFTGQYAANCMAPLLTAVTNVDIVVPRGGTRAVVEVLELKAADRGHNVTLHERDEFALQHRLRLAARPGWFASPIIQYLDLLASGGRGKELAENLLDKIR